jgi:hypothetical protein
MAWGVGPWFKCTKIMHSPEEDSGVTGDTTGDRAQSSEPQPLNVGHKGGRIMVYITVTTVSEKPIPFTPGGQQRRVNNHS